MSQMPELGCSRPLLLPSPATRPASRRAAAAPAGHNLPPTWGSCLPAGSLLASKAQSPDQTLPHFLLLRRRRVRFSWSDADSKLHQLGQGKNSFLSPLSLNSRLFPFPRNSSSGFRFPFVSVTRLFYTWDLDQPTSHRPASHRHQRHCISPPCPTDLSCRPHSAASHSPPRLASTAMH